MNKFETFLQLHHKDTPLLIPNAWDVSSAKVFEQTGFTAIATSSRAVAHVLGYEDGEKMSFDLLIETVKRICDAVNVPVSVDMERGYSNSVEGILQNIDELYDIGVVGFNIEDAAYDGSKALQPVDNFKKTINSIADHLARKNMQMFINARTDSYVLELSSPLEESLKRIGAFENAGATGIFVPFVTNKDEIKEIVRATSLPVNVVCRPNLPSFTELAEFGIKRISMGAALYHSLMKRLEKVMQAIKEVQSFKPLYE